MHLSLLQHQLLKIKVPFHSLLNNLKEGVNIVLIKLTDDKMEGKKGPESNQTVMEKERREESMQNFTLAPREILLFLSKWI